MPPHATHKACQATLEGSTKIMTCRKLLATAYSAENVEPAKYMLTTFMYSHFDSQAVQVHHPGPT